MQNPQFDFTQPIVDSTGRATLSTQKHLNELWYGHPIIGSGSPEGVVEAYQFSEYIDRNGGTGRIKYIKMQTDINGDKTKGWVIL